MLEAFITLISGGALIIFGLTAISNVLLLPRLRRLCPQEQPFVSILIPARNEAAVIGETVRSLLAQRYPNFELIVLDDSSSDGTGEVVRLAAGNDPRLCLLSGAPLPEGWGGKNWACHQLSEAAQGEWLLFTDADVRWAPEALSALMAQAQRTRADLLTVWATQVTQTWPERLIVPLMLFAILAYLPIVMVHYSGWMIFAAANGQVMLFRRAAYQKIGGHAAVRDRVVEDVTLARRIKVAGLRLRMFDGNGLISCRMYQGWSAVRDGFAKNILAGHGDSVPFLLISTVLHWLAYVAPFVWLLLSGFGLLPLLLCAGVIALRMLTAAATRQRLIDAFFMPLSVILMTRIAAQALYWRLRHGGVQWKGRTLRMKGV
ncbi:MAG: glycosyltransferase family 2 protein [Aggregatilineales bacterium]